MGKKERKAEKVQGKKSSNIVNKGKHQPSHESNNDGKSKSLPKSGLSMLQQKFMKKLDGGRFRYINEMLYTRSGKESFDEFQKDPELFDVYHSGYREQVTSWPENPLDRIISKIKKNYSRSIIADMGCGEGRLAESISNKVHSFDLVSRKSHVCACDIAHTPLKDGSVDVVVFCLSLMGTNVGDFLKEAYRILRPQGTILIEEVRSRFESDAGGVKKFMKVIKSAGFDIIHNESSSNTMFFELECRKNGSSPHFDQQYSVKPCVYKRR